jgi:sugar lactone lactonase YvrE
LILGDLNLSKEIGMLLFIADIDSVEYRVDIFDFDLENGRIGNRRVLTEFEKNQRTGLPDGLVTDIQGNL